jgi:hypothetical protein
MEADLRRVPNWLAEMGPEQTFEEVKQTIQREFGVILDSLRDVITDNPDILGELFSLPTPEEKRQLVKNLTGRGRNLTVEQLDELHEFTYSLFDSLLRNEEGKRANGQRGETR